MASKKPAQVKIEKIVLGSWYQRTTLHLTEIYGLISQAKSRLALSSVKLKEHQKNLSVISVSRQVGQLEHIEAVTKGGITVKFYEDGLYLLELNSPKNIKENSQKLLDYYQQKLDPALNYIFSLGAPTPKVLANIKIHPPFAVSVVAPNPQSVSDQLTSLGSSYSQVSFKNLTVYKTQEFIIIVSSKKTKIVDDLIKDQIFFREFKDQLEKYLNIHRSVWEEISLIKERKNIKGNQISPLRNKLEDYQKTVQLIDSRINQMAVYVNTRKSISSQNQTEEGLSNLFQYKYETLLDTHTYIKQIWAMTQNYLSSAIKVISSLQAESTKDSIKSLRLITTIGVISGIFGYLSKDSLPKMTTSGLTYFTLLLISTWIINKIVSKFSSNQKYDIKFTSHTKI